MSQSLSEDKIYTDKEIKYLVDTFGEGIVPEITFSGLVNLFSQHDRLKEKLGYKYIMEQLPTQNKDLKNLENLVIGNLDSTKHLTLQHSIEALFKMNQETRLSLLRNNQKEFFDILSNNVSSMRNVSDQFFLKCITTSNSTFVAISR